METSLVCIAAMAFSTLLFRKASPLVLASAALVLSLLRVDLTLLVAFGVLLLIDQRDWVRAAAVGTGSALSLAFIRITMGHLLPDTAVAKVGASFQEVLYDAGRETAGTASFGLGVVVIWIVSAAAAWSVNKRSTVIANLPFPTLILLAAIRGQQIHGVRYMIWTLIFSVVWNILSGASVSKLRPIFLPAFVCLLMISWIFELPIMLRVDRGRAQNFDAMDHAHLEQLHGGGMAGDVGFIGYFSKAPICDLNGLINGSCGSPNGRTAAGAGLRGPEAGVPLPVRHSNRMVRLLPPHQ